jgi:hypothetical protein
MGSEGVEMVPGDALVELRHACHVSLVTYGLAGEPVAITPR